MWKWRGFHPNPVCCQSISSSQVLSRRLERVMFACYKAQLTLHFSWNSDDVRFPHLLRFVHRLEKTEARGPSDGHLVWETGCLLGSGQGHRAVFHSLALMPRFPPSHPLLPHFSLADKYTKYESDQRESESHAKCGSGTKNISIFQ